MDTLDTKDMERLAVWLRGLRGKTALEGYPPLKDVLFDPDKVPQRAIRWLRAWLAALDARRGARKEVLSIMEKMGRSSPAESANLERSLNARRREKNFILRARVVSLDRERARHITPPVLRTQRVRCGRTGCKCQTGELHGPYWYAGFRWNGRSRSVYLGSKRPPDSEIEDVILRTVLGKR